MRKLRKPSRPRRAERTPSRSGASWPGWGWLALALACLLLLMLALA